MSLCLCRLKNSIQVLRRLVREESEERNQMEDDSDRPIRRERDVATPSCYPSYLVKLTNHVIIRGGFDLSTLKVAMLVDSSVIIVNMFFYFCNKVRML